MKTYQLVIAYSLIGVAALAGLGAWYKQSTRLGISCGTIAAVGLVLVVVLGHADPEQSDAMQSEQSSNDFTTINTINNNEQFTEILVRPAEEIYIVTTTQRGISPIPLGGYKNSIVDTTETGSLNPIYCGNMPVFRHLGYYLFLAHYKGAKHWLFVSSNAVSDGDFASQPADELCNGHHVLKTDKSATQFTADGEYESLPEAYMLQDIVYYDQNGGLVDEYSYQWWQLQGDGSHTYIQADIMMSWSRCGSAAYYDDELSRINLPIRSLSDVVDPMGIRCS